MSGDKSPILNVNSPPRIVPVVLPASADLSQSGKVRNVLVFAVDTSGWLAWDDDSQEWSVVKKGHRLLRDYYMEEAIDGVVDTKANEDRWKTYQRYISDWQNGKTLMSFPTEYLPQKVQDMQRGIIGPDKVDPWLVQRPKPTTGATSPPTAPVKAKAS
jgi:hypothetical protein